MKDHALILPIVLKVVRKEPDDGARRSLVLAGPAAPRPEDLLGYEQVDIGPTTNFVGNHMTRGVFAVQAWQARTTMSAKTLLLQGVPHSCPSLEAAHSTNNLSKHTLHYDQRLQAQ